MGGCHQQGNVFSCLVDKEVYVVRKLPRGRKLIPTKLVLKIKLASDGRIDKYKTRCVVAGYRQTAGLDYDPEGVYSPLAEPTTPRLVLANSSALKLNIDHLDIKAAFLNGEIPENEQFFSSPPPGFKVPDGIGWLIKKGLYGALQSGSIWAKTFRAWMHKYYPQYIEAGNERCIYVCENGFDR